MDDYVKPLVEEYERVEARYQSAMEEIVGLREQRERLRRAVNALAPGAITSKQKPKTKTYAASGESVGLVRTVVETLNGDQFTAADLQRRFGQRLPADGTLRSALRTMHENGELRLVKTGRGSQKTYEVIR